MVMSKTIGPETSNISQFNLKLYMGTAFHKKSPESPAACQGLDLSKTRADFDSSRKLRCVRVYDFHSALGSMFVALSQTLRNDSFQQCIADRARKGTRDVTFHDG